MNNVRFELFCRQGKYEKLDEDLKCRELEFTELEEFTRLEKGIEEKELHEMEVCIIMIIF